MMGAGSVNNRANTADERANRSRQIHMQANPGYIYRSDEPDLLHADLSSNQRDSSLIDRLLGCAYGQALGDAYGLATEFETRDKIALQYPDRSHPIPFPDYVVTSHSRRWKRGDWTDDTDQWVLLLETLIEDDGNEKKFASRLRHWIEKGFPELGDTCGMGLGTNVYQVVYSPGYLDQPIEISRSVWERGNRQAAPNGAVMRCSASAFVHYNNMAKLRSTTIGLCKTTHYDPRCIASCLAVCLTVAYFIRKSYHHSEIESLLTHVREETLTILGTSLSDVDRRDFLWHTDSKRTLDDLKLDETNTIGYTFKCLAAGFYGARSNRSFIDTLSDLIRHGGDADTNGAVCGTMYGARHGYRKLPQHWLRAMPYKKWLDEKIITCLYRMGVFRRG